MVRKIIDAGVAQLAERILGKDEVAGSNPAASPRKRYVRTNIVR